MNLNSKLTKCYILVKNFVQNPNTFYYYVWSVFIGDSTDSRPLSALKCEVEQVTGDSSELLSVYVNCLTGVSFTSISSLLCVLNACSCRPMLSSTSLADVRSSLLLEGHERPGIHYVLSTKNIQN